MKSRTSNRIVLIITLCIILFTAAFAQGGGHLPSSPPNKPKTADPVEPTKSTTSRSRQPAALDRIDGKWLTTGNDFGTSELVLSQTGTNVRGNITWADGRTGELTGTFTAKRLRFKFQSSTGETGSGWLELSWANFLGGPWKNQRVKDGSWTLNRVEGQWCLGGDRNRIRRVSHDAAGRLTIITEDGSLQSGYQEGWLYLNSPAGPIKGNMFYKGNRIDWANGTFWTWCGRSQ